MDEKNPPAKNILTGQTLTLVFNNKESCSETTVNYTLYKNMLEFADLIKKSFKKIRILKNLSL